MWSEKSHPAVTASPLRGLLMCCDPEEKHQHFTLTESVFVVVVSCRTSLQCQRTISLRAAIGSS